jgi:DNA-directed RNA polymerase specialized sigma24 family protein
MHNENSAVGAEQVPQDTFEAILKRVFNGLSPEAISPFLGLSIYTVQQAIANDQLHRARMVQTIQDKSRKYRCRPKD